MSHVELKIVEDSVYCEEANVVLSNHDNCFLLTLSNRDGVMEYTVTPSEMKKLYKFLEANQELFVEPEPEGKKIPVTYSMIRNTVGWSDFCAVTGDNPYAINSCGEYDENHIFYITKSQFNELW